MEMQMGARQDLEQNNFIFGAGGVRRNQTEKDVLYILQKRGVDMADTVKRPLAANQRAINELSGYLSAGRQIKVLKKIIEELEAKNTRVSIRNDGMPKAAVYRDKMADYVAKKMEYEQEVKELEARQKQIKRRIITTSEKSREILSYIFIFDMGMFDVMDLLVIGKSAFYNRKKAAINEYGNLFCREVD